MSEVCCILCGSNAQAPIIEERGYQAVRCLQCGLVFVESPPSQEELRVLYESDKAASLEVEAQMQLQEKKLLTATADLDRIQKYVRHGRLFEVGCGAGYFLWVARQRGFIVKGLELNSRLVQYGRQHLDLDIAQGSLSKTRLPSGSFDVIYMRNVLSHLLDPVQDFEIIRNLLADKGYLFFETGNGAELSQKTLELMKRRNQLGIPDHLFFFSHENVKQLVEQTGLEIVSFTVYSMALHDWIMQRFERKIRRTLAASGTQSGRGRWKEKIVAAASYFLTYGIGRYLPKSGRHCTIRYVCRKQALSAAGNP